jgi:iron complex transport system ATP-binding protein
MTCIRANRLACGYGGSEVISDVSFEAKGGEFVALLGANGSGKSTLIKTICGLLPVIKGELTIEEQSVAKMSARELALKCAMVPQEEAHRFPFTVLEVVAMGRLAASDRFFESAEDRDQARNALAQMDCGELADKRITELSGGERQRVLTARALTQSCPILLLDEPSAHLDFRHQLALVSTLKRLAAGGILVIAALHDVNLAALAASRVIALQAGRVVADLPFANFIGSDVPERIYEAQFERIETDAGVRLIPHLSSPAG